MAHATRRSEAGINRIVVIESTSDGVSTGCDLVGVHLRPFKLKNQSVDLGLEYHVQVSRAELEVRLAQMATETSTQGGRPILHLEIHGLEDQSGLMFPNGDTMMWSDLAPLLTAINRASRNNLVVVLAVCFGAALKVMLEQPHDRAPVFALIGPTDEISLGVFPRGFRAFYTALLEGGDGDTALNELNVEGAEKKPGSAYRLRTAEGAFRDRIRPVLAGMTRGSGKRTQVEAQLTQLLGTPWGQDAGVTAARKAVKKVLTRGVEPAFNRVRDHYLMLDLFPEQAERFTLSYKDCAPPSTTEDSR